MRYITTILFCTLLLPTMAQNRILLDGSFSEWENLPIAYSDVSDDDGISGVDFGQLKIHNDENYLFFLLEAGAEINFQDINNITLYIDTDANATTGLAVEGIGAELEYTFGSRSGLVRLAGSPEGIFHDDIGLVSAPTVSSNQFEFSINRNSVLQGMPLFPGENIRLVIKDRDFNGDVLPDQNGGLSYSFANDSPEPLPDYSIARKQQTDFRVLSYNVLANGLFDPARIPAFTRILQAIQPDIIGFQEIYNRTSAHVAASVESILPSGIGENWYHAKAGPDNYAISRYPILASFKLDGNNSDQGNGAFLIDLPAAETDLLFIVAHTPCCDNNAGRQIEIDAIMGFLRDAQAGTGPLQLAANTPIIISGDMNLVGDFRQLESLLTGNIIDEESYGPDFQPDWDGSDFIDSKPYTTEEPMTFTWFNEESSFSPGRLDFIIYSGSRLNLLNSFSLFSRSLPQDSLTNYGLWGEDVIQASDHLPLVADFQLRNITSTKHAAINQLKIDIFPNPSSEQTSISLNVPSSSFVRVSLLDMLGNEVSMLLRKRLSEGRHDLQVDLSPYAPGVYLMRVNNGEFNWHEKILILR